MKKNIHPKYQQVLFVDSATGHRFVCGSTLQPEGKETFNGIEYPVYKVSTSSASHPFFTGSKQLVDAEGRVDKFKKRYAQRVVAAAATGEQQGESQGQSQEEPKKQEPKKQEPKKESKPEAKVVKKVTKK